jgi:Mg/Co/Ni transporter MgtE
MAALAIRFSDLARRITPRAAKRALIAGSAWGVIMGAGLAILGLWECGAVCLSDVAMNTLFSVAAGVVTIGPLAASGRGP